MDMSKKDNDGLEGSFIVGADPDLQIYKPVGISVEDFPMKPFTYTYFSKLGWTRQRIGDHLRDFVRKGILKSEIRIVKSKTTGAAYKTRVYWKT